MINSIRSKQNKELSMSSNAHPIYLDNAATTKIHPLVAEAMVESIYSEAEFGNSSSTTHPYGWQAQKMVENARESVASLLNSKAREIIFTSGATESNNIIIQSVCRAYPDQRIHVITSELEHKSVLDTFMKMKSENVEVTLLKPDSNGLITADILASEIKENTVFVSLMHVNNEVGNITNISEVGRLCEAHNILFHVDACQSFGKLAIDVKAEAIDFLSFSAHKIYGPKGIGGIWARYATGLKKLTPLVYGGSQERAIRPGTLANHQIVGFSKACSVAKNSMVRNKEVIEFLRNTFLTLLENYECDFKINSELSNSFPGIINISLINTDEDLFLMSATEIAISTGSACNSQKQEGSHVLQSLGVSINGDNANVRISFGYYTTLAEMEKAAICICESQKRALKKN